MQVRKATIDDINALSELAYKSKAYWGYSKDFLDKCIDDLTVTVNDIESNPVYVMEIHHNMVGFFNFELSTEKLDALFIDPDFIGKGIGKLLWKNLLNIAKDLDMKQFTLDSDPNAEGFYLKMGAKKIGSIPSSFFTDRSLPLLQVEVE